MTLIIGIKCKDGIVMAADGAATLGSMGQGTAQQPIKKLDILNEKIIIGVSGPVGLGQLLKGEVESMWDKSAFSNKKPYEVMSLMSQGFRQHIIPELKTAQEARNTLGNAALSPAISTTLIALPVSGDLCLFQFDPQGSPEQTVDGLFFVSIGSGQPIADPFLGFLRRIFWPEEGQPTIDEGIFAAVWALDHAIRVNPGGVAEPMQVITMKQNGGSVEINELSVAEIDSHRGAVNSAESKLAGSLAEFKETMATGDDSVEEPPQP